MFWKAVSTQGVTNPVSLHFFIVCRIFLSSLTLCNISIFLTRSVQLISSTTLQNSSSISDLLSEVFKFQHHTMLCSKCSTCLVSSLNLSPNWSWKESSCWMLILSWQSWIECEVYILHHFYYPTQTVKVFHIFQLFLIYHNLYWGGCMEILTTLVFSTFIPIPLLLPVSVSLSLMPCITVSSLPSSSRSSAYFTVRIRLLVLLFGSLQTCQELPCCGIRCRSWTEAVTNNILV